MPDLCDANSVKGYPSIFLYENGAYVEQFKKERTLERINKWLDDRLPDEPPSIVAKEKTAEAGVEGSSSAGTSLLQKETIAGTSPLAQESKDGKAATTQLAPLETGADIAEKVEAKPLVQFQDQQHHKRLVPNPDGRVISVTGDELNAYTGSDSPGGAAFVKYFTTWCGHCKALEPTWTELAEVTKGKVNIVEVNCEVGDNKAKCREAGVKGYPTLIFYNQGEKADYRGARKLEDLKDYAEKAALTYDPLVSR